MSDKIIYPPTEIWAHNGLKDKPTDKKFSEGNITALTKLDAPKAPDHNYIANRADVNVRAILQEGITAYDPNETYPLHAKATAPNGDTVQSVVADNKNNPTTDTRYWKLTNAGNSNLLGGSTKEEIIASAKVYAIKWEPSTYDVVLQPGYPTTVNIEQPNPISLSYKFFGAGAYVGQVMITFYDDNEGTGTELLQIQQYNSGDVKGNDWISFTTAVPTGTKSLKISPGNEPIRFYIDGWQVQAVS